MAIVNSYPHAVPTITDTVIGTKYVENQEPSTKSFSIGDIVDLVPVVNPTYAYKVYTALLTQSGENIITTILENTIGDIVWSQSGTGQYEGLLYGAFTDEKTYLSITTNADAASNPIPYFRISNNLDGVFIETFLTDTDGNGFRADGYLNQTPIEIRVYN
jgi:hypothetical protein